MSERSPYSRVYWTVRDDPRLASIYPDDHHLATWLRLLIAADMAWPAPADVPASVKRSSLTALVDAGVIELLPGGLFRFHGLDTERGDRRAAAQASAAHRSGIGRSPDGQRSVTERLARRDETRQDEHTQTRAGAREDEPDGPVLAWLAGHGAYVAPTGGGLHRRLTSLCERHGADKVIAALERLGTNLSDRQYVLGVENALDIIPAPDTRAAVEEERKAERDRVRAERIAAQRREHADLYAAMAEKDGAA